MRLTAFNNCYLCSGVCRGHIWSKDPWQSWWTEVVHCTRCAAPELAPGPSSVSEVHWTVSRVKQGEQIVPIFHAWAPWFVLQCTTADQRRTEVTWLPVYVYISFACCDFKAQSWTKTSYPSDRKCICQWIACFCDAWSLCRFSLLSEMPTVP